MKRKTDEGDEYDDPDDFPGEPLSIQDYFQIEQALEAVNQSERHFEWPKGNHYLLKMVLREVLGVDANKENMKDIARKALDRGYKTR